MPPPIFNNSRIGKEKMPKQQVIIEYKVGSKKCRRGVHPVLTNKKLIAINRRKSLSQVKMKRMKRQVERPKYRLIMEMVNRHPRSQGIPIIKQTKIILGD